MNLFHHHFTAPKYLTQSVRRQIIELYAASAISGIAASLVTIFEPIFLYNQLGFTIPKVLLFFAAVYGWYMLLIPWGAKFAARYGFEHSIYVSIPFQILYWVCLIGSLQFHWLIFIAPLFFALQKSFYWPAYHASLARFSHTQQTGSEFSLLYAVTQLSQIAGPLAGGLLSQYFGSGAIFVIAMILYVFSFVPLATTKEVFTPTQPFKFNEVLAYYKKFKSRFVGYLGFGEELLVMTIWPIFIFTVFTNYSETGAIVTGATLLAAIVILVAGKLTDKKNPHTVLQRSTLVYALSWLARLFFLTPLTVFLVDAFSRASKALVFVPLSALVYESAGESLPLAYAVFFEQALAIGKLLTALLAALLFFVTGSWVVLFAFGALLTLFYLKA